MEISRATDSTQALGLGARTSSQTPMEELGQDAFLKLMLTQIKAQDPMNPMDGGDFLSQLAEFSTVSGIEKLNSNFASLAASLSSSQAIQASQLVGRSVLISGGEIEYDPEMGMQTAVDLPDTVPDLTVNLYDASGELVRSMEMGQQGPGLVDIAWDGLDDSGETLPAGRYRFEATGSVEGRLEQFESLGQWTVEGASIGAGTTEPLLLLQGGSVIALGEVREIR
ncbi:flagellar hook capping protein [Thioflavicoccus mobilis 8321]|uniref:Basal-body rod modification protein FlgD n=1 Tax=Thioflavicoccus mobilis 8321 TaxID=765912 RepID=L0GZI3_9GAMM|nr:flagellar hook assembly protein FlgD [Thioflavicoccus mobilis]AGA92163.1 flagellar hook capping protein [Thioflavicoccus mobilis 8321]